MYFDIKKETTANFVAETKSGRLLVMFIAGNILVSDDLDAGVCQIISTKQYKSHNVAVWAFSIAENWNSADYAFSFLFKWRGSNR